MKRQIFSRVSKWGGGCGDIWGWGLKGVCSVGMLLGLLIPGLARQMDDIPGSRP